MPKKKSFLNKVLGLDTSNINDRPVFPHEQKAPSASKNRSRIYPSDSKDKGFLGNRNFPAYNEEHRDESRKAKTSILQELRDKKVSVVEMVGSAAGFPREEELMKNPAYKAQREYELELSRERNKEVKDRWNARAVILRGQDSERKKHFPHGTPSFARSFFGSGNFNYDGYLGVFGNQAQSTSAPMAVSSPQSNTGFQYNPYTGKRNYQYKAKYEVLEGYGLDGRPIIKRHIFHGNSIEEIRNHAGMRLLGKRVISKQLV